MNFSSTDSAIRGGSGGSGVPGAPATPGEASTDASTIGSAPGSGDQHHEQTPKQQQQQQTKESMTDFASPLASRPVIMAEESYAPWDVSGRATMLGRSAPSGENRGGSNESIWKGLSSSNHHHTTASPLSASTSMSAPEKLPTTTASVPTTSSASTASTIMTSPLSTASSPTLGSNNTNSTHWPHFRFKPHPTLALGANSNTANIGGHHHHNHHNHHNHHGHGSLRSSPYGSDSPPIPMTPPRSSNQNLQQHQHQLQQQNSYASSSSAGDDSDNAMCTPTFGSGGSNSGYSRRNSTASVMALDTPPPLSLMDLETSLHHGGGGNGGSNGLTADLARLGSLSSMMSDRSSAGSGSASGSNSGSQSSGMISRAGSGAGFSFPFFTNVTRTNSMMSNGDYVGSPTRSTSSRANSIHTESLHARKPSEDANMSDGGNVSGGDYRGRRRSPAVVPFERSSSRKGALLPKPKGLLKVFSQLEEEVHHNRHEYSHERETTLVQKSAPRSASEGHRWPSRSSSISLPSGSGSVLGRRHSASKLNPEQELIIFRQQQEELERHYEQQRQQHQQQEQQRQEHQQQQQYIASPRFQTFPIDHDSPGHYVHQLLSASSTPSSPSFGPITRSKRKASTSEDRFEPYHSSHLKRRAVSPSVGPIVSHRRSPSGSPARHSYNFPPTGASAGLSMGIMPQSGLQQHHHTAHFFPTSVIRSSSAQIATSSLSPASASPAMSVTLDPVTGHDSGNTRRNEENGGEDGQTGRLNQQQQQQFADEGLHLFQQQQQHQQQHMQQQHHLNSQHQLHHQSQQLQQQQQHQLHQEHLQQQQQHLQQQHQHQHRLNHLSHHHQQQQSNLNETDPGVSSQQQQQQQQGLNIQHTSQSFSELSLDIPKAPEAHHLAA